MSKNIVIIGCGWLGQQVAPMLAASGYQVFGSRRTPAAAAALPPPIQGIVMDFKTPWSAELLALLKDAWAICCIPPGGRQGQLSDYPQVLQQLGQLCQSAGFKGGIHISSTGIYQGLSGEVNEQAEIQLNQQRVALLAAGEQALQQQGNWLTLRLSGLMGPERHPGCFIQGKTLSGAAHPVNMIHSSDVAAALVHILAAWPLSKACYNLSSPELTLKSEFYQAAVASLGWKSGEPDFSENHLELARQVIATAITEDSQFRYRYPSARDALSDCD